MDEIRRKLALFEAQLSGQSLHARLIGAAGLFLPAVGLIAGIVVQNALTAAHESTGLATGARLDHALAIALSALLCLVMVYAHRRLRPAVAAWGTMLCFVGLGAVRLTAYRSVPGNDVHHLVANERILATVRGRIITKPVRVREDWCFAELTFADPPTFFYLELDQVKTSSGWVDASGVLRMQVGEPALDLEAGDTVQAYCWLHRFEKPTNPGQFNTAAHLARRNIYVGASVPSRQAIERHRERPRGLLRSVHVRIKNVVSEALLSIPRPLPDSHGLTAALLLGDRGHIDRNTYEAFRRTGLLHLISLSGMHLGIFAGLVWWLCRAAGLMKPGRAIACIVATAAFLSLVPARAPTIRAAVIVWVFCVAVLMRRRTSALNSLSMAAIILLLIRPTQVFEAGWQLSFTSIVGILAMTGPVEEVIHTLTRHRLEPNNSRTSLPAYVIKWFGHSAVRLFAAGIAAWLGGAGILLYHFWTITPLTSLWTVLVFPLVLIILIVGFFKIVLAFLLPTLAALLGVLLTGVTDALVRIVTVVSRPEINTILIGRVAVGVVILYYGLVLFVRFGRVRRPLAKDGVCIALGVFLVVWVGGLKWSRTHRDCLQVTCLDVGHGQAIVARLPGTTTMLFDAGSLYRRDIGSRIVLPFLNSVGINRLEAIIISHGDIDHVNGIPEIVAGCKVCHVYACEPFFTRAQNDLTASLLVERLGEMGRVVEPLPRRFKTHQITIRALWPPEEPTCTTDMDNNNRSLVSLIEFGGIRTLLCSDIEQLAQQRLLVRYPNLKADVVAVPHHGSSVTLDGTFLPRLGPRVQMCSCDQKQYTRRATLAEIEDDGRCYTARNGAITVCVTPNGMVSTTTQIQHPEGE